EGDECTVDSFGHVYDSLGPSGTASAGIGEYTLAGRPLHQFTVAADGDFGISSVDVAPDECTIYYLTGQLGDEIGSYNVCTQTQGPLTPTPLPPCDQLRALADGDIALVCDVGVYVFGPSG